MKTVEGKLSIGKRRPVHGSSSTTDPIRPRPVVYHMRPFSIDANKLNKATRIWGWIKEVWTVTKPDYVFHWSTEHIDLVIKENDGSKSWPPRTIVSVGISVGVCWKKPETPVLFSVDFLLNKWFKKVITMFKSTLSSQPLLTPITHLYIYTYYIYINVQPSQHLFSSLLFSLNLFFMWLSFFLLESYYLNKFPFEILSH